MPEKPWYQKAQIQDPTKTNWRAANYENKLATAADWLRVSPKAVSAVQAEGNMDALKPYATKLVYCIDNSLDSMHFTFETQDVATTCMAIFGWLPDDETLQSDSSELYQKR